MLSYTSCLFVRANQKERSPVPVFGGRTLRASALASRRRTTSTPSTVPPSGPRPWLPFARACRAGRRIAPPPIITQPPRGTYAERARTKQHQMSVRAVQRSSCGLYGRTLLDGQRIRHRAWTKELRSMTDLVIDEQVTGAWDGKESMAGLKKKSTAHQPTHSVHA